MRTRILFAPRKWIWRLSYANQYLRFTMMFDSKTGNWHRKMTLMVQRIFIHHEAFSSRKGEIRFCM